MPNAFMLLPPKNHNPQGVVNQRAAQLQGLEPASEHDTEQGPVRVPAGRCSHGIQPLQGIHLERAGPIEGPPLMSLRTSGSLSRMPTLFRGLPRDRVGLTLPSLPTLMRFPTSSPNLSTRGTEAPKAY
jgi:hypothetical protein